MDNITFGHLEKKDIKNAQNFMLDIIKNDFGYDYNTEWHWDITNLENTYLNNKAAFFTAKNNFIIGTIAGRPYDKSYPKFKNRYNSQNTLGIWRHYIERSLRGKGLGTSLLQQIEDFAQQKNYKYLYLHTQKTIKGSLEYWLAKGYLITYEERDELQTVHLEKTI